MSLSCKCAVTIPILLSYKCFISGERVSGTHSVSRLDPRANLDTAVGRKKLPLLEIELLGANP